MKQGTDHGKSLFPSAGELAGDSVEIWGDARQLDQFILAFSGFFFAKTIDAGVKVHVLLGRKVLVKRELLGHVADLPANRFGVLGDVFAQDIGMSTGKGNQTAEGADQRCFAGAIGAKQAEDFTFADDKINMIDSDKSAELDRTLGQVNDFFDAGPLDRGVTMSRDRPLAPVPSPSWGEGRRA